jgi:hypothetical protein
MAKQEIGFTPAWQNRCQAIVIGVDKRHQYYSGDREFLLSRPGIFGFAGGKLPVVSTTTRASSGLVPGKQSRARSERQLETAHQHILIVQRSYSAQRHPEVCVLIVCRKFHKPVQIPINSDSLFLRALRSGFGIGKKRKRGVVNTHPSVAPHKFHCPEVTYAFVRLKGIARAGAAIPILFRGKHDRSRDLPGLVAQATRKVLVQHILKGNHVLAQHPPLDRRSNKPGVRYGCADRLPVRWRST